MHYMAKPGLVLFAVKLRTHLMSKLRWQTAGMLLYRLTEQTSGSQVDASFQSPNTTLWQRPSEVLPSFLLGNDRMSKWQHGNLTEEIKDTAFPMTVVNHIQRNTQANKNTTSQGSSCNFPWYRLTINNLMLLQSLTPLSTVMTEYAG